MDVSKMTKPAQVRSVGKRQADSTTYVLVAPAPSFKGAYKPVHWNGLVFRDALNSDDQYQARFCCEADLEAFCRVHDLNLVEEFVPELKFTRLLSGNLCFCCTAETEARELARKAGMVLVIDEKT